MDTPGISDEERIATPEELAGGATGTSEPSVINKTERSLFRKPFFTFLFGLGLAAFGACATFAFWFEMESASLPLIGTALKPLARLAGFKVGTTSFDETPLWVLLGFAVAVAITGLGFFVASIGTLWAATHGARKMSASPVARERLDASLDISRQGLTKTREVSRAGAGQAQELAKVGLSQSKPHAQRLVKGAKKWRERRSERRELE